MALTQSRFLVAQKTKARQTLTDRLSTGGMAVLELFQVFAVFPAATTSTLAQAGRETRLRHPGLIYYF
jgi:hypothetical protein